MTRKLFFLLFIILYTSTLWTQTEVSSQYIWADSLHVGTVDTSVFRKTHVDQNALGLYLDSLTTVYRNNAYLGFAVDTIVWDQHMARIYLHHGYQYRLEKLKISPKNQPLIKEIRWGIDRLDGILLTEHNRQWIADKIIDFLENRGYPFTQVSLDSIVINNGEVDANLKIIRNELILFDTIEVSGPIKIHTSFLSQYLDIKKGAYYDNSKILAVQDKIKDLKFLSLAENPSVLFVNKQAILKLKTKKSRSSSFDFLIGLLRNTSAAEGPNYIITGEFTAELLNKLGYGESLFVQFKRLRPETQELQFQLNYPYPFELPFGVDGSFELYRNANDFLEVKGNIGLRYIWNSDSYLRFFYNNTGSYLLDVDTTSIINSGRLPDRLDVNYNSIGLGLRYSTLDYQFNPRKGLFLDVQGQAGLKQIRENASITQLQTSSVDFDTIYNSVELSSYQFQLSTDIAYYIPLLDNMSIKLSNRSGGKVSGEQVFKNEFFRIGGNRLLRGFNEQSILASIYSVSTFELRFVLAQENNNFTLSLPFVDYGWIYDPSVAIDRWDEAIGVGVGMQFETSAGLFNFAIASGQRRGNPFDFNDLKIHFGYVNLF